jgi:hypothetical protein
MSITKYFLGSNLINTRSRTSLGLDFSKLNIAKPPADSYIADPFLLKKGQDFYCFFEIWDYHKGKIAYSKLDENLNLTEVHTCLEEPFHLSFPAIFSYNGKEYMIPESSSQNKVFLYECKEFPSEWRRSKTLLHDQNLSDVAVFVVDEVVYLLGNDGNNVKIFFSKNLDKDLFQPHPKNPSYFLSHARPAGNPFFLNGEVYRATQICAPSYGYGMNIYKIEYLSVENFIESLCFTITPDWFPELTGCHTLNIIDDALITDGRLRINSPHQRLTQSLQGGVYRSTDNDAFTDRVFNSLLKKYQA